MKMMLHPLVLRIWHWLYACLIVLLIVTGVQLRIPGMESFPTYRSAVLFHKYTGFLMGASFLFWLIYSIANGSLRKFYSLHPEDLRGILRQARYYLLGVFQGKENPFHPNQEKKFNPLQKLAYLAVMGIFSPIVIITGILFSDILFFRGVINGLGGVRILDAVHVIVAYIFVLYLIVHVYMSTLGETPFTHIKAMFTGYEDEPERKIAESGK